MIALSLIPPCESKDEINRLKTQLLKQERELSDLNRAWEMKMQEAKQRQLLLEKEVELAEKRKKLPRLVNINEDVALSFLVQHFIEFGSHKIGSNITSTDGGIKITGSR